MFFGFGFPLFFFFPFLLIFFAFRAGSTLFRNRRESFFPANDNPFFPNGSNGGRRIEAQIFKLAYKLKGRVTVSDIVVETGLSIAEAESAIQEMVDNSRVRMEVSDSGLIRYEFPEIISRFEESEP